MNLFAPLFAAVDPGTVIKIVVILLLFVVPAIGRLLAKIQQIPPPDKRPLPPPSAPPDNVADEIGEFMRRAAQRQRSPKGVRRVAVEQTPPTAAPVRAEVVGEEPVGGQVEQHVKKYLDAESFARREDALGKEVAQADRQIDQRLQQVFDHRVSKLEAVPGESATAPVAYEPPDLVGAAAATADSFATGLLDLITNPDSLRQAIVLNEILQRPEGRWG
jgi:hypothetical protein